MSTNNRQPIRVLVVDDEPAVLDAYRQVLGKAAAAVPTGRQWMNWGPDSSSPAPVHRLPPVPCRRGTSLNPCSATARRPPSPQCARPVARVVRRRRLPRHAHATRSGRNLGGGKDSRDRPAGRNRHLHCLFGRRSLEISRRVPPEDKLFYLQKPFHPHEVRQMALALGGKAGERGASAHAGRGLRSLTGLAIVRASRAPEGCRACCAPGRPHAVRAVRRPRQLPGASTRCWGTSWATR